MILKWDFIVMEFDNMDICTDAPWHVPTSEWEKKDVETLFLRLTLFIYYLNLFFYQSDIGNLTVFCEYFHCIDASCQVADV